MEDVAVYGYVTPLRVKIILALALTDAVVRDVDVIAVRIPPRRFLCSSNLEFAVYDTHASMQLCRAMHTAYRLSVANPFLKVNMPLEGVNDHAAMLSAGSTKWKAFRKRVDNVGRLMGASVPASTSTQSH